MHKDQIHSIFKKHASCSANIQNKIVPTMRDIDFEKAIQEIERPLLIDFLTWYSGNENNQLPDDMIDIVDIWLKK